MRKLIITAIVLFICIFLIWVKCNTNVIKKTNIKFEKIDNNLDIYFSSTDDITELANSNGAIGTMVYCPLINNDFSFDKIFKTGNCYLSSYEIESIKSSKDSLFHYKTSYTNFKKSIDSGTETNFLDADTLKILLKNKNCLECKIEMSIYGKDYYYSNSMCIPKDSIIKVLN